MLEIKETGEPLELGVGKIFKVTPAVGTAERGAQGDDQQVDQPMSYIVGARGGQVGKIAHDTIVRRVVLDQAPARG